MEIEKISLQEETVAWGEKKTTKTQLSLYHYYFITLQYFVSEDHRHRSQGTLRSIHTPREVSRVPYIIWSYNLHSNKHHFVTRYSSLFSRETKHRQLKVTIVLQLWHIYQILYLILYVIAINDNTSSFVFSVSYFHNEAK